jgi:hypothetical protein
VPATVIGRMLDPEEAAKLVRKIERGILETAAGAIVKRRAVRRRRA